MAVLVGPACNIRQHCFVANEGGECDIFLMEFHVRDAVLNCWLEDDRPIPLPDEDTIGHLQKRSFVVKRDDLLRSQNLAFNRISSLLSLMGIPSIFHTSFAQVILSGALFLANETTNFGRHKIHMVMDIDLIFMGDEEEEEEGEDEDEIMAEVMTSSLDDVIDLKVVPATKASIKALKKVKFEDVDSIDKCIICLEEFSLESKVSQMPCSHVYHGDCIVQWLERNHMCPLCRFEMPTILS